MPTLNRKLERTNRFLSKPYLEDRHLILLIGLCIHIGIKVYTDTFTLSSLGIFFVSTFMYCLIYDYVIAYFWDLVKRYINKYYVTDSENKN